MSTFACVPMSLTHQEHAPCLPLSSRKPRRSGIIPYQAGISHGGNDVSSTFSTTPVLHSNHFLRLAEAAWREQALEIAGPELESWLCHHSTCTMTLVSKSLHKSESVPSFVRGWRVGAIVPTSQALCDGNKGNFDFMCSVGGLTVTGGHR